MENLKILLIGARDPKDTLLNIIPLAPRFPIRKWYKQGIVTVTDNFERPFPQGKTLSMIKSYLAYKKAQSNNAYDTLAIDRDGFIREGSRTNFFAIKGRTIFKAPDTKVLDGVTQRIVLKVAKDNNFKIEEADIQKQDLKNYDGAFLTSTSSKILPIKKIDEFEFTEISEQIKELIKLFDAYLKDCQGKIL